MSQSGSLHTGSGGGGSGIQTINGDTGSITGSTVTIYANQASNNAGTTVRFVNSGTISTLDVSDGQQNTLIGTSAGAGTINVGSGNTGVGYGCFASLAVGGTTNTALGYQALQLVTTGDNNVGVGANSLQNCTGSANIGLGRQAGVVLTTGSNNCFIGQATGGTAGSRTGSYNTLLGFQAGSNWAGAEASNIYLGALVAGVNGESNKLRIGNSGTGNGQQDQAFIAGITGVTAVGSPVAVKSDGQLSDLGFGTSGQVLTSNGAGVSPTWQAAGGSSFVGFQAYLAGNAANVTGDGTIYTIPWDTESYDVGNNFNSGTGVFTAPTTGRYKFDIIVSFTPGAGQTQGFVTLVTTATSFQTYCIQPNNIAGNGFVTIPSSVQCQMTAGDTAHVDLRILGGAKDVTVFSPLSLGSFSGYFLG